MKLRLANNMELEIVEGEDKGDIVLLINSTSTPSACPSLRIHLSAMERRALKAAI